MTTWQNSTAALLYTSAQDLSFYQTFVVLRSSNFYIIMKLPSRLSAILVRCQPSPRIHNFTPHLQSACFFFFFLLYLATPPNQRVLSTNLVQKLWVPIHIWFLSTVHCQQQLENLTSSCKRLLYMYAVLRTWSRMSCIPCPVLLCLSQELSIILVYFLACPNLLCTP